jgi:hypothetical protein
MAIDFDPGLGDLPPRGPASLRMPVEPVGEREARVTARRVRILDFGLSIW